MPKRISKKTSDLNESAFLMVQRTEEQSAMPEKSRKRISPMVSAVMSQMGRKGGKIGGKRSLVTLTPEERRERALLAAKTRWAKKNK